MKKLIIVMLASTIALAELPQGASMAKVDANTISVTQSVVQNIPLSALVAREAALQNQIAALTAQASAVAAEIAQAQALGVVVPATPTPAIPSNKPKAAKK